MSGPANRELRVIYLLRYYRRSVIIMSICALRMYRGLVDSAALNGLLPVEGAVSATVPSIIQNLRPGC